MSSEHQAGKALVDFASNNDFPDEEISGAAVTAAVLTAANTALSDAKIDLEASIRRISRDVTPDVETWISNAKALRAEFETVRALAGQVVKQAEQDGSNDIQAQEAHVQLLEKEVLFTAQLTTALRSIKNVEICLRGARKEASEGNILESLALLADFDAGMKELCVPASTSVFKLLLASSNIEKDYIHEQFLATWSKLISMKDGVFKINQRVEGAPLTLENAVTAIKHFQELDQAAQLLWQQLDKEIMKPRTEIGSQRICSLEIHENSISVSTIKAEETIELLVQDLQKFMAVLENNLPNDFLQALAKAMMPTLGKRVRELWLDRAIPASLDEEEQEQYYASLGSVKEIAEKMDSLHWPGTDVLHDWHKHAPKNWLSNRREVELESTRNQMAQGVGETQLAEHIEVHDVPTQVPEIPTSTPTASAEAPEEWDAAWDSDEKGESSPIAGKTTQPLSTKDEDRTALATSQAQSPEKVAPGQEEEEEEDAWGWGDEPDAISGLEDGTQEKLVEKQTKSAQLDANSTSESHAVTLKENYLTSSIPHPVYKSISNVYEDGIVLSKKQASPIALATAGLFGLPTQILAMYRAVSKHYYSTDPSGNMLIYNDCTWLCDRLSEYLVQWKARNDLAPRIHNMVKLEPEIAALKTFGKRAYKEEMVEQRRIIADTLGGAQNFLQTTREEDLADAIDSVVAHIRLKAAQWKPILPYSVLASALGSLVNNVSSKLISDVFDLTALNPDAAERTAMLISKVETLDDLFIRPDAQKNKNAETFPETPRFADQWMKMKFLSEVLQSNLKDIRMLWFESHLSLYFTKQEVLDLIELSFEDNVKSKQLKKEIRESKIS